jgi:60 kDa SS-A/Ro ribonucleoprotein
MLNVQSLIKATRAPRSNTAVVNREGAPAYHRSLQEQVVQVLTTGTLGDTFYASGRELGVEAIEVLVRAREENPGFLARALVYAREHGLLKTLPVLGLVVLSGGRGKTRQLFETIFGRVVQTPDDLRAFVALSVAGTVPGRRGLGGVACDATRVWIQGITEYHALKYGSAASREVTLRDILRMTHPRPSSPALSERFGWLVGGVGKLGSDPALNPQIRAFETLKRATTESDVVSLIREGRLPYEVVVPAVKATTPAIWAELLRQAPYLNLLRNLATFTRHGVFADGANVRYAVAKLTDPRAVERSKVLPFRFFDAWRAYTAGDAPDSRIADALRTALELSFRNMPSLGNRMTCIGTDVSGSMNGPISTKGTTRFIDIAGIFTGALLRRVEDRVIPLPFDTRVHPDCGLSSRDDILVTAEKVSRFCGGGTAVGAPMQYLLDRKIKVDTFIGITDNVDWAHGDGYTCKASFLDLWLRYRNEVAPDARAYLVTIAPYREVVAPSGTKGVRFIYGWSANVLSYIARDLDAGASQVETIERMELVPVGGPNGSSRPDAPSPCGGEGGEDAQQEDDGDA